ncbi:capsule biosynthesis protein CapA [Clostridium puniceum]|uniref:Capsule biosynthesis protein CapA n=1 Tax=Clostridium puniceum TaxID=29367 RepID=A0A1S8TXY0_9CLOT|nr:CapA family protein [Clostridium puniceum]OOM82442.1 capsule biosynthesis protein CapA [Clostridium puniceum]
MNKRSSRSRHGRKYAYLKSAVLLIISILIVGGLAFYLKSTNSSINKKAKTNSEDEYTAKETTELGKQEENTAKEVKKPEEPVKKTVLISFAGDFTLGTDTKFAYDSSLPAAFINSGKNYSYFMQNVSNIFSSDDYTLVNLETTFTDSNEKAPKDGEVFYNFKGPKEYVNILTKGSIEGVTIANNHIYDYGKQGITDTINVLKENNVDICGEGYKILRDIQGVKFGFLGYTGWEYSNALKTKISTDISQLRKEGAEVIIPYFHWGIERSYEPYDVQQNLARFCIDNGAEAVIGSHPHVIQSMESYKGKLIVYSMGNFCFGGNSNPPDKRTFILQAKANIEDNKFKSFQYKILPAMISSRNDKNDYIPTLAVGDNKANILKTLNELSPTLKGKIKDEFFAIE